MPLTAYNPAAWSTFFSSQVSASAALTGLLFVAVSINLSLVISNPLLAARAAKALMTLVGLLMVATLCLVPGQPNAMLGKQLVAVGIALWIGITSAERKSSSGNPYIGIPQKIFYLVLAQACSLPVIACGVSLLAGRGGGLYWLVTAVVGALIAALIDAWVLLIEVQR